MYVSLNKEEITVLAAQHQAARIVADIVYHVLELAFVGEEAIMVAFLPKRERRLIFARIRATPNHLRGGDAGKGAGLGGRGGCGE